MDLSNILAVSGMSGLFKLVTTRSNGLVVEDFDSGKRTFVSLRKHQFTPLESVAIYTYSDVEEIKEIFTRMQTMREKFPIPEAGKAEEYQVYFREILPDYNEDQVYVSDIRKVIKWFHFLDERKLITIESASDQEE